MTLLRDYAWKLKYTPDDGDLVRQFYVPALRSATRYHRLTGYFTAYALALAARGIEGLVLNGGTMRMVVGCTLGEAEVKAIERGASIRQTVDNRIMAMPPLSNDPSAVDALELLAWMIAQGHLDVKVSVPCDEHRRPIAQDVIFHEKSGIVEDKTGDRIAFTGSINETAQGWRRNWESFSVFTSWNDLARVNEEEHSFARIWADKAKRTMTLEVPTAVRDQLLQFLPDPDQLPKLLQQFQDEGTPHGIPAVLGPTAEPAAKPDGATYPLPNSIDEQRRAIWRRVAEAARQPDGGDRVGEATSAVVPWPHQVRAFGRLYHQWPPKLLIADEVGLGKTVQAGLLLRQAWLAGRVKRAIILAPKAVCKQWQIELREKFNLNWPIYDGQKLCWLRTPAREHSHEREVARGEWHKEPFVIMSSHLARRRERQAELLEAADPWDLVVLDEAHHARRRGAGSSQDSGPNALLRLMRRLRQRTDGLVLLTATPLQVHPIELWDLLDLLGLPPEWTPQAFERFFSEVTQANMPNDRLEWLASLFRANEAFFGQMTREDAERFTGLSRLRSRKIIEALRDNASIPRRQLSPEDRRSAAALIRRSTPVRALVSRHTRELLRRYYKAGKLSTPIAARQVEDRFIPLSFEEDRLYKRVEDYISTTYNRAAADDRNAVGFVMTIYRRRLASSFRALRKTLENRRTGVGGFLSGSNEQRLEEDIADLVEAGEEIDVETVTEEERRALASEEIDTIGDIIEAISKLPTDTKARRLVDELADLKAAGFGQAMVFTQFTDTMDFLRDHLSAETGRSVMCFSGRGGEVRSNDGRWTAISREDVKRRFKEGKAEILVCTDAASEGLNFQFCGALINYDMPWNPMRVEQRIGRIDRLGQRFADIRIVNLHYQDTVEADVYQALRTRISVFEKVVGGLQPILTRLPKLIESTVLAGGAEGEKGADAVRALDAAIEEARGTAIDIDEFADEDLDMPTRPDPAITLADLRAILEEPALLPPGAAAKSLNEFDYRYVNGEIPQPIRVTVDPGFYEMHADSVEFWTPGSPAFPDLRAFQQHEVA